MMGGMWRELFDARYMESVVLWEACGGVLCDGRCVERMLYDWRYVESVV